MLNVVQGSTGILKKVNKSVYEPRRPPGWSLSRFLLTLDGKLAHCRVTSQHYIHRYPLVPQGGERHCESQVSCQEHNTVFLATV